jgi:hypothetical protein
MIFMNIRLLVVVHLELTLNAMLQVDGDSSAWKIITTIANVSADLNNTELVLTLQNSVGTGQLKYLIFGKCFQFSKLCNKHESFIILQSSPVQ